MTTTPEDIAATIAENATGPKSVSVDGTTVNQHSIPDQIAAQNHAAAQQATSKPGFGFRFQQIKPVYR